MFIVTLCLIGDIDFESVPYNITFPAGVTNISFNIMIYDDDVLEGNENFTLTMNAESLPDGITIDDPNTVIMIIRNDDSKCVEPISYYDKQWKV